MNKRVLKMTAMTLCLVILFSIFPTPLSSAYYDVNESHWAYPYITNLSTIGFMQGYGEGSFMPDKTVTNAEFTAIACRMRGMDDTKLEKSEYWAEPDIQYALFMNWFTEKEMPYSAYSKPITREFAAKIAMLAFFPDDIISGASGNFEISDENNIDEAYKPYVKLAYSKGILTGYTDGSFKPKGNITRGEAATVLYRAWKLYHREPNNADSVTVPILLYHHISDEPGYTTPDKFRRDMENLKSAGFNTIFYSELYEYVSEGKPLPKKPIVVSLDDGYYSNYQYVYPTLKELGMKAEISVIGCWVGIKKVEGVIPHFSWSEAMEMYDADTVHIQAHSYRMHDYDPLGRVTRHGVMKRPDESYKQYIRAFVNDTNVITNMIKQNMGYDPIAYTYPNGFYTPLSDKILESLGYKITLTTAVGINTIIKGDTSSLRLLKRIAVDAYNGDVVNLINRSYF